MSVSSIFDRRYFGVDLKKGDCACWAFQARPRAVVPIAARYRVAHPRGCPMADSAGMQPVLFSRHCSHYNNSMNVQPRAPMDKEAFLAWAQGREGRFELVERQVVMAGRRRMRSSPASSCEHCGRGSM